MLQSEYNAYVARLAKCELWIGQTKAELATLAKNARESQAKLDKLLAEVAAIKAKLASDPVVDPPIDPPIDHPPPLPLDRFPIVPQRPPASLSEIRVPEDMPFGDALEKVQPGQAISVRDGKIEGRFIASRGGKPDEWVVIKTRKQDGVELNGALEIRAPWIWTDGFVHRMQTNGGYEDRDFPMLLAAPNLRVTRTLFDCANGIKVAVEGPVDRRNISITYCDFEGKSGGMESPSHVLIGHLLAEHRAPEDFDLAYCHFVDRTSGKYNKAHFVYLGHSKTKPSVGVTPSFRVRNCLMEGDRSRGVYLKRHGYIGYNVWFCTLDVGYGALGFRHGCAEKGRGGVIEGNWLDRAAMIVNGTGSAVRGNRQLLGELRLMAGCSKNGGEPLYPAASNTLVADHYGPEIALGSMPSKHTVDKSQGGKTRGVEIWQGKVDSKIVRNPFGCDEDGYLILEARPAGQPEVVPMSEAELRPVVGRFAPLRG